MKKFCLDGKKKKSKSKKDQIKGGSAGYEIKWPTINAKGLVETPNHETMSLIAAWLRAMAMTQINEPGKAAQMRHLMGFDSEKVIVDYEAVFPGNM